MAIGIVSDDDFLKEIGSYKPATPLKVVEPPNPVIEGEILPSIVDIPKRGRKDGDVAVPESLQKIIGEEALLNGRQSAVALAAEFGLSPSSASAYAVGATSTSSYNQPKSSILSHINKSRERAMKKAAKTLNAALGSITQEKLDYLDADKVSGIAKDMSVIIKNLEPKIDPASQGNTAPQFVIFAPQFRDERSFDMITVQE
jgi:hypothetical protein